MLISVTSSGSGNSLFVSFIPFLLLFFLSLLIYVYLEFHSVIQTGPEFTAILLLLPQLPTC